MSVTVKYRGRIAIITLNVPAKLNALTSEGYFLLADCMRKVANDPEIVVTALTGRGRLFSAGADIQRTGNRNTDGQPSTPPIQQEAPPMQSAPFRQTQLRNLAHIIEVTEAFYTHPKLLVTALNGPCVGLSAALVAYSDFIYAMPHVYLFCPFTSLGITAEGGSTALFSRRMGFKFAAEALLMSKRIQCEELVRCGFINEVFDTGKDADQFLDRVLVEVETRLFSKLNPSSMLHVKALMRKPEIPLFASQTVEETLGVVDSLARAAKTADRVKEGKKGARL
ncbi:uncharacterized protein A1O5_00642 [Cladophialophora psammophila CBS 110553]|uniref:Enoyl-CoA hydratase n=1 Tax=Cladophialophora psammophila CBS 110553 TaxID=1182543 RepID=W9Y0V7_9EURO|nr:uncharacterized protein A1O5_00642 [Cladophialophora psammophila CBS 110553]EXJ76134.1 hypothetical protein A1O5_00642 [Cladophialophora psammophila CBS 110553]